MLIQISNRTKDTFSNNLHRQIGNGTLTVWNDIPEKVWKIVGYYSVTRKIVKQLLTDISERVQ